MNGTGSASPPLIDSRPARRGLTAAAQRNAEMIASLDLDRPVPGSEWSIGETAAHLIVALRGFTHSALGEYEAWNEWEDRAPVAPATQRLEVLNRAMIAAEPRRSPLASARAITEGAEAFLRATDALPSDQAVLTPWYGTGTSLTVAQATCLLLGEQVVHGYDITRAVGRKASISKQDAVLIFSAVQQMMPKMADPAAIGKVTATYELHLAGAGRPARFVVRIADGGAVVEPASGQRVDCHVLADPVALLLLGYGRISQWQAIGRAKMITWGTKPWLAFRFTSFFSNP
jgi:uncharacterized protein (TIGR03083 family)